MGILSRISRNLLFKFKPKSLPSYSSDLCRIFSPAAFPDPGIINPQQAGAPIVAGDLNRKSTFLIVHQNKEIANYSLLSSAAAENNMNSWNCSPFPGRPGRHGNKYHLLGSCKELILFLSHADDEYEHSNLLVADKGGDSYFQAQRRLSLWNPTTNRIKTLPPSLLPRPRRVLSIDIDCFGFGFDHKSQDYKLVCFLQYGSKYISLTSKSSEVNIEVYSLKTNSWKQITAPPDVVDSPYFHLHSIHINGVCYWAEDDILSFDFADEKFSRIPLPDEGPHITTMLEDYCLAEFHGSLALIVPYWVPTEELTEEEEQKQMQQPFSIEIWEWNGKTWNLAPRVAVGDFPVGDSIDRVLGLFQNEYLFLQGCNEPELMLFNCKTGKLENLGIHHDPPYSTNPVTRPGIFPEVPLPSEYVN